MRILWQHGVLGAENDQSLLALGYCERSSIRQSTSAAKPSQRSALVLGLEFAVDQILLGLARGFPLVEDGVDFVHDGRGDI